MKSFIFCLILAIVLNIQNASAQSSNWCITGIIVNSDTGNPIPSAHVLTVNGVHGTVSNIKGQFKICGLTQKSVRIGIGHTSFEYQELIIYKEDTKDLYIRLNLKVYNTKEVQVVANSASIVKNYIPGKMTLRKAEVLALPSFMGSPDVLRGLQLMPGMQSVSEGNSGIFVRGGSPGQNFVLFDNIELMNPTHLMGIYSVFNPLLTQKVDFYKGNAPIHQSSRLASSIIVSTRNNKEGDSNWEGNIGNIVTNLTYNGESKNKKWYFSTGVRRSYLDVLGAMVKPFLKDDDNYFKKNNYTFYDWNGKLRYKSANSLLSLTWYLGQDDFRMTSRKGDIHSFSKWGNKGVALSWRTMITPLISMKNSFDYTAYNSDFGAITSDGDLRFKTDYGQTRFRSDYTFVFKRSLIRWGVELIKYQITPQNIEFSEYENSQIKLNKYNSLAAKLYGSNYVNINENWSVYGALALNYYQLLNQETEEGNKENTNEGFWIPNIVATLNYNPTERSSFKASYAYNSQNIHLASIASIPLPTDVWMPSTKNLPHEQAHQLTFGYFKDWTDKKLQLGAEAFGKTMNHQLLLSANIDQDKEVAFEDNFLQGKGISYGCELYFKKQVGHLAYTLAYTLAWAKQRFLDINNGKWHDAKYDRRHDLNITTTYALNNRIDFGAVFIYATGNKATLATGRYWLMGSITNDYAGVNNYRMPAYHRLDVSMNYKLKSNTFKESILNFSIINLYSRSNPYYIYYEVRNGQENYDLSIKAKQMSLFPIMPSVSWRFKF